MQAPRKALGGGGSSGAASRAIASAAGGGGGAAGFNFVMKLVFPLLATLSGSPAGKYSGGNGYNPQPTPDWQKPLTSFFVSGLPLYYVLCPTGPMEEYLQSAKFCAVLHFACFQIDLAHLYTNFQSCFNGRAEASSKYLK